MCIGVVCVCVCVCVCVDKSVVGWGVRNGCLNKTFGFSENVTVSSVSLPFKSACNAGDPGLIPGLERSAGEG